MNNETLRLETGDKPRTEPGETTSLWNWTTNFTLLRLISFGATPKTHLTTNRPTINNQGEHHTYEIMEIPFIIYLPWITIIHMNSSLMT